MIHKATTSILPTTIVNTQANMNAQKLLRTQITCLPIPKSAPVHSLPKSNSYNFNNNSSTNNRGNRSYNGYKFATLLALPAFIVSNEFESQEDKENRPPLRCSSQAIHSLKSSTGFLAPTDFDTPDTRLCIGVSMIPHPAKRAKGGEDAYYISEDMKSIGVADGVGGWGDIGVDPALYSRMLMAGGKRSADCTTSWHRDPVKIMADAYKCALDTQGSATACVLVLDGLYLKSANLGDSGFMVIRGNEVVFRSKEQQHSFNFPYQLGTGSADMPYHAVAITINILPGDLVIVGSDGLWDNLFDDEIIEATSQATEPMMIAQIVARQAYAAASSKSVISPFAKAARENGYPLATGGKMDDITVLAAKVVLARDGGLIFA